MHGTLETLEPLQSRPLCEKQKKDSANPIYITLLAYVAWALNPAISSLSISSSVEGVRALSEGCGGIIWNISATALASSREQEIDVA